MILDKQVSLSYHKNFLYLLIRNELSINYIKNIKINENHSSMIPSKDLDNNLLFNLIKLNKLIPFFSNNSLIKYKFPVLYKNIKQEAKNELLKSLRLSYLTSDISLFLRQNKIKHLILKGIPLSKKIYNDSSKRGGGDLDILIDKNQISSTIELLKKKEFYCIDNKFPLNYSSVWFKYSRWVYYEITLVRIRDGSSEYIDLHWRINNNSCGLPSFEEMYSFKENMILNDINISVPNLKYNIILVAVNAAKDKWLYHRNLIDLELLIHINRVNFGTSLSQKRFFIMSLYKSSQIIGINSYKFKKRDKINLKIANFISKHNYELENIKYLKKNKLKFRIILFMYKIYLCENLNDLLSNICINLITPKSIVDSKSGEIKKFYNILLSRVSSILNLIKY